MTHRICTVQGCGRKVLARGWCGRHYQRWAAHGDTETLLRAPNGAHRTTTRGYVAVFAPDHPLARDNGYVLEHRMVAYDAGLLVDLSMEVHHRDGNKQNNALENFQIMTKAEHARHHNLVGSINKAKTHCPQDHPYDEMNTYVNPKGRRNCRICVQASRERYVQRIKGLAS